MADKAPVPVQFQRAQHSVVFVLADNLLVAQPAWRSYVTGLVESLGPGDTIIPVAITAISNLPPRLREFQAIQLSQIPDEKQGAVFLNDALHDLCRVLDPNAAKVSVFLSHAKRDGLQITNVIRRHLHEIARLDEFFDASDIPDGTRFGEFVAERARSTPALLAIQTDVYASREWCRLEVLEAKRRHVPIVVLSAVQGQEPRSFPYIGNTPVIRWLGETSLPAVVRALLGEVLRHRYFPRRVEAICRRYDLKQSQIFAYPPELLTALTFRAEMDAVGTTARKYLYPDPPLGSEELKLLAQFDPDLHPVTPTALRTQ